MKKVLIVCTVAGFLGFELNDMKLLRNMDFEVHVATNFIGYEEMKDKLVHFETKNYQVDFARNPFSKSNLRAYHQLKKIMRQERFDLIHCHTPVGGVLARLVSNKYRKNGTKVVYTAHGFHFFEGAPLKNWLLYYPIEKVMAIFTDVLITINKEDYKRARSKFKTSVKYIPGVGVDTKRFSACKIDKNKKREEIGISKDAFVLLSVGELAQRKNQQVVIDALGELKKENNISNLCYVLVGEGCLGDTYRKLIKEYDISDRVYLLGNRNDVDELCVMADVFVHPSVREGLGIAPLEGMAAGLPLISSYINGIKDYTCNDVTGCCIKNPLDVTAVKNAILRMWHDEDFRKRVSKKNISISKSFSIEATETIMIRIYQELFDVSENGTS